MVVAVDKVEPAKVLIPSDAIGETGDDLGRPTVDLLRRLNLLPLEEDFAKAGNGGGTFAGPPDSVSVIEAGITAASKWWTLAIGASSAGLTGAVASTWKIIGAANQPTALLAAGLAIAAGTLGIAYILGSDVRGRSAAMVATIESRSRVAVVALTAARLSSKAPSVSTESEPIGLAGIVNAENISRSGADEQGWRAICARQTGGTIEYLLVKGSDSEWVGADQTKF